MLALARQIVSGEEDTDSESLEDVFAQARDVEAASHEFLVDEGWKLVETLSRTGCGVDPELEPLVEVHSNGVNGNVYVEESVMGVGNSHDLPKGSSRSSPGPSSWPGNRRSRRDGTVGPSPRPFPYSSGH